MFICAVFVISGLLTRLVGASDSDWGEPNTWVEPNAWDIHSPSANICPVCDICDTSDSLDSISMLNYKNAISSLLNRNTLKINAKTGRLERKITFSLTASQLSILENSSDITTFHATVMSILETVGEEQQKNNEQRRKYTMLLDVWKYISSVSIPNVGIDIRFALVACAVLLSFWFVHKRHNKSLLVIVIVFMTLFGYFYTYLECNRKLQNEELVKFIRSNDKEEEPNLISKIFGTFFRESRKDKQIKQIENDAKIKMPFCRPDTVAIMYMNEMFFNQLEVLVEKMTESMTKLKNTLPFPFNYFGMIALPYLLILLLPQLFQYIFSPALFSVFQGSRARENLINNGHVEDRLSGENLKTLLNVLKTQTEVQVKPPHSAVEDVKDVRQAITSKSDDNKDNLAEKSKVEIDDTSEDDDVKKES